MQNKKRSIYQLARNTSGLTQGEAAQRLYIGESTIRAYESESKPTVPPDSVVNMMIELYGTPWLAYLHLKNNNAVGKKYLPNVEFRDLSANILDLQAEMEHVANVESDIRDIGRDNRIDVHEFSRWEKCKKELGHLVGAGFTVLLAPSEKEKARFARAD